MTRTKHPIPWPWPSERKILIKPEPADEGRLTLLYLALDNLGVLPQTAWSWPDIYNAGLLPRGHDAVPKLRKLGYPTLGKKKVLLLDELTLARLVAGEDPNKWDIDASLIARSDFIELSLKYDYLKQFLVRTLLEKSVGGDFLGALVDGGLDGAKSAAIEDLKARIGSIELFGSGGRKLKKIDGQQTALPIKDPNQAMKLEELEAILDILESL